MDCQIWKSEQKSGNLAIWQLVKNLPNIIFSKEYLKNINYPNKFYNNLVLNDELYFYNKKIENYYGFNFNG